MNSANLTTTILNEIDWRIKELTIIKKLTIKRALSEKEKELIKKFAIPNIYATWEGYVKVVFRIYINNLNLLCLKTDEIHSTILTHSLDMKFPQIGQELKEFDAKRNFIDKFITDLFNPVLIETKLPTESNVNWKVLNQLLKRFNLEELPKSPYKNQLNDLLRIRNSVAHGENTIPITTDLINKQISNVTELMDKVMIALLNGCKQSTYKNNKKDI
jgi:hypothetical protein